MDVPATLLAVIKGFVETVQQMEVICVDPAELKVARETGSSTMCA